MSGTYRPKDTIRLMESTYTPSKHGGAGRGQGDIKKHLKDVEDATKFPRLDSFFKKVPSPCHKSAASGGNTSMASGDNDKQASAKRLRADVPTPYGSAPSQTGFAQPVEPEDVAPATKSYLLGRDGIIAQALSSMRSGLASTFSNLTDRFSSDIRIEVNHLTVQMRKEMKQLTHEVDTRRELLRQEAVLFSSSQRLASTRSWLTTSSNGKYHCGICTRHSSQFSCGSQTNSKWILGNHGIRYGARFAETVCKHEDSDMHILSTELEEERSLDPLYFSLQCQLAQSRTITTKLFRTVYDNCLHYRSFLDYENLVHLQHCNDGDIGDQLHSRMTAALMLQVVYRKDRMIYKDHFTTINPATGRLPIVGVAADKVSDKRFKQWQCNAGRSNLHGSPFTFCTELRKMGTTAKGVDCYENMVGSCDDIGITSTQRKTYSFDGEAVYSGQGTTADTCKSLLKAEDEENEIIADPPHSGELLKEDMHKSFPFIYQIHTLIREVYSNYVSQGKKITGMERIAEAMGVPWRELHYIFEVRMVESEYIAIEAFMVDYPVIITQLRADIATLSSSSDLADQCKASQCKHWLRRMRQFKFVAVCLVLLDFDKKCKIFSKAQQADESLALDYPSNHERYKASLGLAASGSLGSHVKRNLASLKAGKYAGIALLGLDEEVSAARECEAIDPDLFQVEAIVQKQKHGRGWRYVVKWKGFPDTENSAIAASELKKTAPLLVAAYERGDSVTDQQAAGRASRAAAREAFKLPEEIANELAELGGEEKKAAETEIVERVRRYSQAMAAATLETFDTRLPMPPVLLHLRKIFDFRRMPWEDSSALESWSNESIVWLVEHKLKDVDTVVLQNEALKVRLWLRGCVEEFKTNVPMHDEHGDVVKGQQKEELALCGDGSIFNVLFTQYDTLFPSGIQSYLYAADYNIAYLVTQCATERIGRNMTLTKPPERSALGDENFKMSVWVSYNGPPIHEVDFSKYVKLWEEEKHQLALFKSGGEQRVLERMSAKHKHTILSDLKNT